MQSSKVYNFGCLSECMSVNTKATPGAPTPGNFTPGAVMKPRPTGALFLSFSVNSTDVERGMTNVVKREMQLHNTSGNQGRCLERIY